MKPGAHDLLALLGAGCLFAGVWWIYPPAALIVIGIGLLLLALSGARKP